MKILFISMAIVGLLINGALCAAKIEHEKSTVALKDAIKVSPSKDNLLVALPDISKNLTNGEVIVCSQKGNDGKYTLFYSSISEGATSEILSGERESATKKMFRSVGGMKPGDWMGYDFTYTKDGKPIPMKAHIFPVTESIICVLVWPISGLTADISFGMEMAKVAPPTLPVAATPLISSAAPMQQTQPSPAQPAVTVEAAAPPPATAAEQAQPSATAETAPPEAPAAEQAQPLATAETAPPPAPAAEQAPPPAATAAS